MSVKQLPPSRQIIRPDRDVVLPHSREAEQGVLGCILIEPDLFSKAKTLLLKRGVSPEYESNNRKVFSVKDKGDIYTTTFHKDMYTYSCTCKDASHFTVNRGTPCEHVVAIIMWMGLKRYVIETED